MQQVARKVLNYYRLTKPGIIYGNDLVAIAGFFVASKRHINIGLLVATVVGISLVMAAACVFNNYIDRDIDRKMARTKSRALVTGLIPARIALVYAMALLLTGLSILTLFTNWLTATIALIGVVFYVVLYGYYKRRSPIGTVVGAIAGAVPPVVGYCAVTDRLDGGALLLFLILVFWQMPHFYAIAIYRFNDYKKAGLPVWPTKYGLRNTKIQILLYIAAFTITSALLGILHYSGHFYMVIAIAAGVYWFWLGWDGWRVSDARRWARQMFGTSLLVITALSGGMIINSLV